MSTCSAKKRHPNRVVLLLSSFGLVNGEGPCLPGRLSHCLSSDPAGQVPLPSFPWCWYLSSFYSAHPPPSQNSIFFRNISIKIKKWTKGQWKVGRVKDEGSSLSEILKLRGRESERCPQLCSAGREIQTLQGKWKSEGGESEELTFFEILQSFHQLPQLNFIITTAWNSRTARD